MRTRELRQDRKKLVEDERKIHELAATEKRATNTEENSALEKIDAKFGELTTQIEQLEAHEKRAAAVDSDPDEPTSKPEVEKRGASPESAERKFYDKRERYPVTTGVRASAEYRAAFAAFLTTGEKRDLQADVDASGGYLFAAEEFNARLIQDLDEEVFMRQFGTVFPLTTSNTLGFPVVDNDPSDADWTSEIASVTADTTLDMARRSLTPTVASKLIRVSQKLLRIGVAGAERIVRERFSYKFGVTQEKGFLTGTGSAQPLGVFTVNAAGVSSGRNQICGTTTAVTADGLYDIQGLLTGAYRRNARWLAHRVFVNQFRKLKDSQNRYLFEPSMQQGQPDMLLGDPLHMSEFAPSTSTTGLPVTMYGDFSFYWIADSLGFSIQRLDELYAGTNEVGFIGRLETDGAAVRENAFVRGVLA